MQTHNLKIDAHPFSDLLSGAKTGEVRNDDRGFEVGDNVHLTCIDGRTMDRTISHIQRGYGLPDGICVLSYTRPVAPVDGLETVAWREDCGWFIASFTSCSAFALAQSEIDELDEEALFKEDWFTQWPQSLRLEGSEVPTHWRPLPQAPGVAVCQTCHGTGLEGKNSICRDCEETLPQAPGVAV